jgi:hypothetical protein
MEIKLLRSDRWSYLDTGRPWAATSHADELLDDNSGLHMENRTGLQRSFTLQAAFDISLLWL